MSPSALDRVAARLVCVGFAGRTVDDELVRLLDRGVRTVILFARNVGTPAEVRALCAAIRSASPDPIAICVDQEGGTVQRLTEGFTTHPPLREVGARGISAASTLGTALALELAAVDIDVDFAPVVDVDTNPDNPVIGARSFSTDAEQVAELSRAFVKALQSEGIRGCAKHFPGHGDTTLDSHFHLPSVPHDLERLRSVEFVPFRAVIDAGVASIMTAHVMIPAIDPEVPATLSRRIVTDLLRGELGYDGVIISDDLEMKAIADRYMTEAAAAGAVEAGVDLVLCCHAPHRMHAAIDGIAGAIEDGRVSEDRIAASLARLERWV